MIYFSLGSNMSSSFGNRFENIETAKNMLSENFSPNSNIISSSFYETPSYPDNNNPKFINTVISIKSEHIIDLESLISKIFLIEKKIGRKRSIKNDTRVIDIDIIDYMGKVIQLKTKDSMLIKVPHERLSLRNFVLFPLKEICPDWIHPKTRIKIDDLIAELSDIDKKSILKVDYT